MHKPAISAKLESVFSGGLSLSYDKGDTILRSEDEPQGAYLVEEGFITINRYDADGWKTIVDIQSGGYVFPIAWVLGDIINEYTFEAMTSLIVKRISKATIQKIYMSDVEILRATVVTGVQTIEKRSAFIQKLLMSDAEQRVIMVLKRLGWRFGSENSGHTTITLPITHQIIGDMACVTRETVTQTLEKMRKNGDVVTTKDEIILNHKAFRKLTV